MKHIEDKVAKVAWMIRITLFKFWTAFDVERWPTDLISYGQVEATDSFLKPKTLL